MRTTEKMKRKMQAERERLLVAYRSVVRSVREASSLQTLMEKERQVRRLLRFLRKTSTTA